MKTITIKKSATLLCGALMAAVATTTDVSADPGVINVNTFATRPANPSFSNFLGNHTFGGAPTVLGGFYSQTVTSGLSNRPGWEYQLNVDYANFGTSYFAGGGWTFVINLVIKPENTPSPITAVTIKDSQGNTYVNPVLLTFTPGSIQVRLTAEAVIGGGDWVSIQWNQGEIPAPGALALLGIAGLAGTRRRRA